MHNIWHWRFTLEYSCGCSHTHPHTRLRHCCEQLLISNNKKHLVFDDSNFLSPTHTHAHTTFVWATLCVTMVLDVVSFTSCFKFSQKNYLKSSSFNLLIFCNIFGSHLFNCVCKTLLCSPLTNTALKISLNYKNWRHNQSGCNQKGDDEAKVKVLQVTVFCMYHNNDLGW